MAGTDDAEARLRRAAALRQQIGKITERPATPAGDGAQSNAGGEHARRSPPRVTPVTPRDFISDRMRDLDGAPEPTPPKGQGS